MNAAENKQLLQQVFSELAAGNGRPFVDCLSDTVRWTIIGSTRWSKTFDGKQAVLTELLGPLGSRFDEPIRITAHRFIAEDNHVVVEARGQATTKDGKAYNNSYCWICRLEQGKVQELIEYLDTELVTNALDG